MSDFSYLFTVFTPTYNRAHTLSIVFESLKNQTFQSIDGNPVFEWLVIDDGSTDNTKHLIQQFQKKADFPIQYHYQDNSGKHIAMNKGTALAKGEFFLPADSDDAFVPETLKTFHQYWLKLTDEEKLICAGINCLCRNGYTGEIIGDITKVDSYAYVHEFPYMLKNRIYFERWGVTRTEVMREFPFPEIKGVKFVPERIVWNKIGRKYKSVITTEPLRIIFFQDDGFSKNISKSYIRNSKAHYHYHLTNLCDNTDLFFQYDKIRLLKEIIQTGRMGIHSQINPIDTIKALRKRKIMAFLFTLFFPVALLLAFRDRRINSL